MLKVGDTIEILEPEDRDNYPYHWVARMDNLIGTKTTINHIYRDSENKIRYTLNGNHYHWDASNLKLLSRGIARFELDEPIIVTNGRHAGEVDRIKSCFEHMGGIYYTIYNSDLIFNTNKLKPLTQAIELF